MKNGLHNGTIRIVETLDVISQSASGMTLTEIATRIGVPKSTLLPIIRTLVEESFLQHDASSNRYFIGIKAMEVGYSYLNRTSFIHEAKKHLSLIVNEVQETCFLGCLDKGEVVYLIKREPTLPIRMAASVGMHRPAYITAIGKALLSGYSQERLHQLYEGGLKIVTTNTVTDINDLYNQLSRIRKTGFAYERGESEEMICCTAVPLQKGDQIVAAISVAMPIYRYSDKKQALIEKNLLDAKGKIENVLSMADGTSFFPA